MENHTMCEETKERPSMTPNERLQTAIEARERYLAENPHLKSYQAEIDRLLDKSGSHDGRMAVLGTLIQGKMLELQSELYRLTGLLQTSVTNGERS